MRILPFSAGPAVWHKPLAAGRTEEELPPADDPLVTRLYRAVVPAGKEESWTLKTCQQAAQKLRKPWREGKTTLEERVEVAMSLLPDLRVDAAVSVACDMANACSGTGTVNYQSSFGGGDFQHSGTPPEEPHADAMKRYHELSAVIRRAPFDRRDSAVEAYQILRGEVAGNPESQARFLRLLGVFGSANSALAVTQKLERVDPAHRPALEQRVLDRFLKDDQGQPRSYAASNWERPAAMELFIASMLDPDEPLDQALSQAPELIPKLDAYFKAHTERFRQQKFGPESESLRRAADLYRDPGESRLKALHRYLNLASRLRKRGVKGGDESFVIEGFGEKLAGWRERLPGKSADRLLVRLTRAFADAREKFPEDGAFSVPGRLLAHLRPGETPEECLARLARQYASFQKRLPGPLSDEAFDTYVYKGPELEPETICRMIENWTQRHSAPDVQQRFVYMMRSGEWREGESESEFAARMEDDWKLTGELGGRSRVLGIMPSWLKDSPLPLERARAEMDDWMGAVRLTSKWDVPIGTVEAMRGGDLKAALKTFGMSDELLAALDLKRAAWLGTQLGECYRIAPKVPTATVRELFHQLILAGQSARVDQLPRILEVIARSDNPPKQEELVDAVQACLRDHSPDKPWEKTFEEMARSHYLTGSYQGLQQGREEVVRRREAGILRADVPLEKMYTAFEKRIYELRVTDTEPKETVRLALEHLQNSSFSVEGPETGDAIGERNGNLLVGGVTLKRKRSA